MTRRASLEEKGTRCKGQAPAATVSGGKRRDYARFAIILAASLALATVVSLAIVTPSTSLWHDGVPQLLPNAAAKVGELSLNMDGGSTDYTTQPVFQSPAERQLHPSTLVLSGYPAVGRGAAELVFTVTYVGDMQQSRSGEHGPDEPPVVRLDVTGSGHRDLYRVTNITSNIGTVAQDIFEPYDYESTAVRAEMGSTYTVRAMVEFVAEGFIPVYARGFDGDIVTVNVAASESMSMSYYAYVATQQNYLDSVLGVSEPDSSRASTSPEKRRAADLLAQHPSLLSPHPQPSSPLAESAMQTFDATGTVMAENITRQLVPVHGILVCVFDESPTRLDILLNTSANTLACDDTDTDGKYEIYNVSRGDPYDMTSADVYASVLPFGYDGMIYVRGHNLNDVYYADSLTSTDYSGSIFVNDFNLRDTDPLPHFSPA